MMLISLSCKFGKRTLQDVRSGRLNRGVKPLGARGRAFKLLTRPSAHEHALNHHLGSVAELVLPRGSAWGYFFQTF